MPAPKGNKNNEKWTEKEAKSFVDSVLKYVQDHPKCMFIGEAVTELGYYRTLWDYLADKFDFDTVKRVESILESRLVKAGLSNETNSTMTIFTLKNNYKWTDKHEHDHTTDGEAIKGTEIKIITQGQMPEVEDGDNDKQ